MESENVKIKMLNCRSAKLVKFIPAKAKGVWVHVNMIIDYQFINVTNVTIFYVL